MTATASTFCDDCGASNPLQATHCFACNAALHPPAPYFPNQVAPALAVISRSKANGLLVPSSLLHSRYSIVSQIGTGGFGAVYQAKDTLFSHRLVAIKEMSQDGLSPQELAEATAAFEHEALLLADLSHPNLPRIHDHFSENGRSYVVMDFITGTSLEDYMDKFVQQFSVQGALEIGIQLCAVLDYLHTRQPPIVFRDVKPANIMRTIDNHVYLIDFGIARTFKPGKAKDTIPLGSKGYAAPEQYGKAQTTPQTDIYGLGATLHQLFTGDDPSLTPFQFAPVQLHNSPISAQLDALLKQMLEMEMSKRPASMAVVKQELQQLLAQLMPQIPSPAVSRRKFLGGCLSVVATLGVSTAFATLVVQNPNIVDALLAHPFVGTTHVSSSSPPPAFHGRILNKPQYIYRGNAGSVIAAAWSPDGQYIASVGTLDGSVQVWNANTGNSLLIPTIEIDPPQERSPVHMNVPALFSTGDQRVEALAWSPDSSQIAVALGNERVNVWSIATGDVIVFESSQPGDANAVAWSPDGKSIAAVSGNTAVEVRSTTTGNLSFTYKGHALAVLTLGWSPDGQRIASGGADGTVQVWDASTGNTNVIYQGHTAEVYAIAWSPDGRQIASGGADGVVLVWEAATGRTLFTYYGHTGVINTVSWRPSQLPSTGQVPIIASGGNDATVQVWYPALEAGNGSTGVEGAFHQAMALGSKTVIYCGHSGPVTSVTWAPDGQRMASSSEDGTVQIWQAG